MEILQVKELVAKVNTDLFPFVSDLIDANPMLQDEDLKAASSSIKEAENKAAKVVEESTTVSEDTVAEIKAAPADEVKEMSVKFESEDTMNEILDETKKTATTEFKDIVIDGEEA